ncbi:MAG TPA: glycosyltransferase family 87 protein [Terracidiphilus sp.]|nr:glycosyltransferase family 87 protein [Terracidiphilus sp.]
MAKRKLAVFAMLLFASAISMGWGLVVTHGARGIILDYQMADIGARCLLKRCDLYSQQEMTRFYLENGGERVSSPSTTEPPHYAASIQVYPPTAELFFAAFALLPWKIAYVLWTALIALLMPIAAFLMWDVAHVDAPDLPFYLAWFLLVNSGGMMAGGNPAGVAVTLCIIASWCFLHNRFAMLGVLCMASSLAIKPHDSGLIWLYLLLLGATCRKRTLQSLSVVALVAVAAIAWVWRASPHWVQELHANLGVNGSNDPAGHAAIAMVNLQTVVAFFRNDPHFYNLVTCVVCAPLILLCLIVTLRGDRSRKSIWLGMAAITVLSLLPLYHRPYDAKLLLLTLPACALLWAEGGPTRWLALLFTTAGIIVTSEIPLIFLQIASIPEGPGFRNRSLALLTTRPAPLILFAEALFFLWIYVRHNSNHRKALSTPQPAHMVQPLPS